MDSYRQGHLFEEKVHRKLSTLLHPTICLRNVLFNQYPIYEIDILIVIKNKIILVECKDFSGTLAIKENATEMVYNGFVIPNFIDHLEYKVKLFNKLFNVDARGTSVVSNNLTLDNVKYTLPLKQIHKLKRTLDYIPDSNISNLATLTSERYQQELFLKRKLKQE